MNIWYAVNRSGQGNIFLERPRRRNGVWIGYSEGFMCMLICSMIEKTEFKLPELTYNNEPVKFNIKIYEE